MQHAGIKFVVKKTRSNKHLYNCTIWSRESICLNRVPYKFLIIFKTPARKFNRFKLLNLCHVIKHPKIYILNQSDEKSDQPGILGLGDPFAIFLKLRG